MHGFNPHVSLTLGAHAKRGLRYSRSVCVSVCVLFRHYGLRGGPLVIPAASELREPEKEKGDFPETTAFESDKLTRSRTALRGPTHQ